MLTHGVMRETMCSLLSYFIGDLIFIILLSDLVNRYILLAIFNRSLFSSNLFIN